MDQLTHYLVGCALPADRWRPDMPTGSLFELAAAAVHGRGPSQIAFDWRRSAWSQREVLDSPGARRPDPV